VSVLRRMFPVQAQRLSYRRMPLPSRLRLSYARLPKVSLARGSYFFTVNLLERYPNDLLLRRIDVLRAVVRCAHTIRSMWMPGSSWQIICTAFGRYPGGRLHQSMAPYQAGALAYAAVGGAALRGPHRARRKPGPGASTRAPAKLAGAEGGPAWRAEDARMAAMKLSLLYEGGNHGRVP